MTWTQEAQPTLTTDRLLLRPFEASDGPRVEELAGDRAIADTTANVPHPYPLGGGALWVARHAGSWAAGDAITYAVTTAVDGLVGTVGLIVFQRTNAANLGYWMGRSYWNRGYTTEAARALVDYGFEMVGLNRIEATHLTRNPASGRVMEKLGMHLEGVQRQAERKWGVYEDVAMRSILRSEWAAERGR